MEEDVEATVSDSLPLSVNVGVADDICNPIRFFDADDENVMVKLFSSFGSGIVFMIGVVMLFALVVANCETIR